MDSISHSKNNISLFQQHHTWYIVLATPEDKIHISWALCNILHSVHEVLVVWIHVVRLDPWPSQRVISQAYKPTPSCYEDALYNLVNFGLALQHRGRKERVALPCACFSKSTKLLKTWNPAPQTWVQCVKLECFLCPCQDLFHNPPSFKSSVNLSWKLPVSSHKRQMYDS